jgi:hypothetical protein
VLERQPPCVSVVAVAIVDRSLMRVFMSLSF